MNEAYAIDEGTLIRHVVPKRGKPYTHTCGEGVFHDVLDQIEQLQGASFTGEEIVTRLEAPHSQVMTALAFLRERGCIVTIRRRCSEAACNFITEDALIEWHALREKGPATA